MRISDWSSDVCSSDLRLGEGEFQLGRRRPRAQVHVGVVDARYHAMALQVDPLRIGTGECEDRGVVADGGDAAILDCQRAGRGPRSEEHTSELQSLMRNSYAVFCLKKKKYKKVTSAH